MRLKGKKKKLTKKNQDITKNSAQNASGTVRRSRRSITALGKKIVTIQGREMTIRKAVLNLVRQLLKNDHSRVGEVMDSERAFMQQKDAALLAGLPPLREIFELYASRGNVGGDSAQDEAYQFQVESADHAETPLRAYEDIAPALQEVAAALGKKTPADLRVYDPYFCQGTCKDYLRRCGFPNVYNRNEDFYKCIKEETLPEFDVLVTNPPYSGDHVERLVKFCRKLGKPCFLLMPKFFYMKFYFASILENVSFICPSSRYVYEPPKNTRDHAGQVRTKKTKKTAPFASMWYLVNTDGVFQSGSAVKWRQLPNEYRDEGDPNRVKGQKKTALADGRKLCKICGQVHGSCKHTK